MRLFLFACFVGLTACAPREAAQYAAPVPEAQIEQVYVATQKALDNNGQTFGERRTGEMNYFRAAVSVPPTHEPGRIEWPDGPPDAATDFVVTETKVYETPNQFLRDVKSERSGSETQVFVHGFNATLSDGMYRTAQMHADFGRGVPTVLFSWASAGDPRGYIYDRDSVLYARDDLEDLLKQLTRGPNDRVVLIAHSMGSQLVMEVMRQAALRGDRTLLNRINAVVLMSPDIDPDVFRRQAEAIGDMPDPFLIFVSQQDRALGLASFITGRKPRLGVINSPEAVADLPVRVIDFTALANGEGLDHAVATTSPSAIAVLRGMMSQAGAGASAFQRYMVLTTSPPIGP
ncbi:alpha/beta hydrolase [Roseovarius rhodophyticola]|uniref:Alpha/beta fold hydrolase n=1 Tax=Roseovarius rhodophyticola TaxID=3080827 RepID=A0ABZ2TKE6_9RHOB|nr:alpha/beta fold hydrolase [Roseovarius sp. W115]